MQEGGEARFAPEVLEVRDPAHDEDDVDGTVTKHLVGDVDVAGKGVVRFGDFRWSGGRRDFRLGDGGDEAVAAAGAGFDVGGAARGVAERAADVGDLDREGVVVNKGIGPESVEEFVACAEVTRVGGEVGKKVEGLGGEGDFGVSIMETAFLCVEAERAESKRHKLDMVSLWRVAISGRGGERAEGGRRRA
jgi:hypothetical protein